MEKISIRQQRDEELASYIHLNPQGYLPDGTGSSDTPISAEGHKNQTNLTTHHLERTASDLQRACSSFGDHVKEYISPSNFTIVSAENKATHPF